MRRLPTLLVLSLCLSSVAVAEEPWSTYRGNSQRTGNTDNMPGPKEPKVLWVMKSNDHFVAAPVVFNDRLYISGLGAFNVSTFHALNVDPKAKDRAAWTKSSPYLKLPTVSSPAIADGKLIFGDGMHQTDGALLHCLKLDKGSMIWQLPVPGTLVHLEGSPTVVDGKVYLGGGAAGVFCVDLSKVKLDGKELPLTEVQKILDKKWAELLAKYEEEKKKDPVFAVEPTEDQLPKPAPVQVWERGKEKWHVDAPVAVANGRVLVSSAYLDKEKVGERGLFCLDAKTGAINWQEKLGLNPWGGPSVIGKTVVVSGSSIGYDTKALKDAKGEITAFDLETGKPKWHVEVKGGVLSCVALTDKLAVATATDGKIRAFDIETGERRWGEPYDAKSPLFAAPAIAGDVVYAGDLKGVIHAINLADGKGKWTLDLGTHPDVKSPGMVYGGPVVHGGRVFVATCNLEGEFARKPTVVVCIGDK